MFKKGDVVEWVCDEYGSPAREGTLFSVLVTGLAKRFDEFSGVIVSAQEKADQREGTYLDCWDTKQFKLKQQDVIPNKTPNNAFPVLKDGMVAETSFRDIYLVCGGKLLGHYDHHRVDSFNKSGVAEDGFRIIKVWSGKGMHNMEFRTYLSKHNDELIWEEQKNAKAIAEIEEQVADLQEQINTLQEKLVTLREEK